MTYTPAELVITTQDEGQNVVLHLAGELDLHNEHRLREHLRNLLADHEPDTLILDLSDLAFTDSTGLAVMVWTQKRLRRHGGHLELHNPRPPVQRVLQISGLEEFLHLQLHPQATGRATDGQ
jgi:anti-sigma B factor antagonist